MNEKLNIQDLIDLLAEKHGMSRKNADSFVKEFFLLIEESLEKDKYVKIKGLGTFKLIDVESRESVNINTGERFQIQGHTKVSFTPDPMLKDIINKPFAHFETVPLNEDTILDDTPVDTGNEDEEYVEQNVKAAVPEPTVVEDKEEIPAPVAEEEDVLPVVEEDILPATAAATAAEEEEVLPPVEEPEKENIATSGDSSSMKYFIGIVVFVVLLCGAAVAYLYFPDVFESTSPKQEAKEKSEIIESKESLPDSLVAGENTLSSPQDTVAESLAAKAGQKDIPGAGLSHEKEIKKPVAAPFKPDSVGYTIVGTETTYTIKEGETLTRVALRFYGTKALWPYIVKHNPGVIKNPDNVPFGTVIKIPKLMKKQ